ncbi:Plug domain-containing protein [Billgrantia gudaonensis]|uniref:Plug domain-containing protein n=1 Tax=Billgrantia gudaonensis TaxID=376427 RepID=A0A3S0QSA8_9GAMM|nr:Plug domain-containing protein [Halomonas gudaonensis]
MTTRTRSWPGSSGWAARSRPASGHPRFRLGHHRKEIEQRDADNTEEVLQYTPGILTGYWGPTTATITTRFAASRHDLPRRDDARLDARRTQEPYAYERVEVLRGANSTLFGPADPVARSTS